MTRTYPSMSPATPRISKDFLGFFLGFLLFFLGFLPRSPGGPREVPGSDKWLPRKLLGEATKSWVKLQRVIKSIIECKMDHLAS